MLSALRTVSYTLKPTNLAATCSRTQTCTSVSNYSTRSSLPRTNWRTAGYPAPKPLKPSESSSFAAEEIEEEEDEPYRPQSQNFPAQQDPTPSQWASHRASLRARFPDGWAPPRKLSRDAMAGLRSLHALDPETFTTPVLAEKFRVSPEAVRRILRSKWQPTKEQSMRMVERERKNREEWIKEQREKERVRMAEQAKKWAEESKGKAQPSTGRVVRGVNSKDRLTLV